MSYRKTALLSSSNSQVFKTKTKTKGFFNCIAKKGEDTFAEQSETSLWALSAADIDGTPT